MRPKLRVVPPAAEPPTEAVRRRIKRAPKPADMLQCRVCGGRELIETKVGVMFDQGRPRGGTKIMYCLACLLAGERVVVG